MTGENQSSKKTVTGNKTISVKTAAPDHELATKSGKVLIYTDGGCSYNPGPGGYGAVIFNGKVRDYAVIMTVGGRTMKLRIHVERTNLTGVGGGFFQEGDKR